MKQQSFWNALMSSFFWQEGQVGSCSLFYDVKIMLHKIFQLLSIKLHWNCKPTRALKACSRVSTLSFSCKICCLFCFVSVTFCFTVASVSSLCAISSSTSFCSLPFCACNVCDSWTWPKITRLIIKYTISKYRLHRHKLLSSKISETVLCPWYIYMWVKS